VLYAKNPHLVIPPASLTKLVAVEAALAAAADGEISLDAVVAPPAASWAENQPPGSSLMFLGPGQRLTWRELLLGLSVSSGNDAAVAIAELLDGSVAAFAERMNRRARELGLVDLFFVEPSGLSPRNSITVSSFGRFLLAHLARYPYALEELYAVRTFTYPKESNREGIGVRGPITQSNRNTLLWDYEGADGFKTGFIDESGYHIAATAEREGRRLIAVVLGVDADSHAVGGAIRAVEAGRLLDYGFEQFRLVEFGYPTPEPVRVFAGREPQVRPVGPPALVVSVPVGAEARLRGTIEQERAVIAPFPAVEVGRVAVELDRVELAGGALVLPAQERGGFLRRLWDGLVVFAGRVARWFGEVDLPVPGEELVPAAG
jgi:serine-type D-Ala-D-Ala carboxypeptidase (penicillin-binding protein 5/6)